MPILNHFITEKIIRPLKKPVWYAVHSLTGIKMQMTTHYHDASMFSASFRVPFNKVKKLLPSTKLLPIELYPGVAEILIQANEFRHIDILYPYNEVAIAIPISYQIESRTTIPFALWYIYLPVSTEDGRWGGVENYGFPKFVAEIKIDNNSNTAQCNLIHEGSKIITLKVKAANTQFQEWAVNNISPKDGHLIYSLFTVKGHRGIDETPGGGSITFGDHPIAKELQSLDMEVTSFRHIYVPKAEAVLSVGREI